MYRSKSLPSSSPSFAHYIDVTVSVIVVGQLLGVLLLCRAKVKTTARLLGLTRRADTRSLPMASNGRMFPIEKIDMTRTAQVEHPPNVVCRKTKQHDHAALWSPRVGRRQCFIWEGRA